MSIISSLKQVLNGQNFTKYSTDEQVVGEWIDGKPLYQKTLIQTGGISPYTRYFVSELSALNIDVIIKDSIFFKLPNNVIRSEYSSGDIDYISALVTNGDVYTLIKGNTVNEMYLTIQYTKTTD